MTASQEAKALGFKSLAQVAQMFNCSTDILHIWHREQHGKFLIVLHGCLWDLNKGVL